MSYPALVRPVRRLAPAILALAALAAPGCSKKATHGRPQVGVTLLTEAHVFYQDLKKTLEEKTVSDVHARVLGSLDAKFGAKLR